MRHLFTCLSFIAALAAAMPAAAQGRETLGFGRLSTNDRLGDNEDRWRTGGLVLSLVRGTGWTGSLPTRPGAVIEYRFRGDIISPVDLTMPMAPDRLFAGTLAAGAHLHFDYRGYEVAAGADIAAIGEQTGLEDLQRNIHDALDFRAVDIGDYHVEDQFFLNATVEVGRTVDLGPARVRPFVELQAGVETLARAGVDVTIGRFGQGGLLVRDVGTGQRYAAIRPDEGSGLSLTVGADVAHVADSHYLPSSRGFRLEETRYRLRAGFVADFDWGGVQYGVTYLSEEFQAQPEGQIVGSLGFRFRF
ncbi:DUF2219 family protein [Rhodobacterales bacterium HKCCE3408]|nr:DUF2219 family protein [Rhodobacterales bacterium HKCCE3408]